MVEGSVVVEFSLSGLDSLEGPTSVLGIVSLTGFLAVLHPIFHMRRVRRPFSTCLEGVVMLWIVLAYRWTGLGCGFRVSLLGIPPLAGFPAVLHEVFYLPRVRRPSAAHL